MEVLEKCLKALINERSDDIAYWVEHNDKKYIEHDEKIQEIFDKISHCIGEDVMKTLEDHIIAQSCIMNERMYKEGFTDGLKLLNTLGNMKFD